MRNDCVHEVSFRKRGSPRLQRHVVGPVLKHSPLNACLCKDSSRGLLLVTQLAGRARDIDLLLLSLTRPPFTRLCLSQPWLVGRHSALLLHNHARLKHLTARDRASGSRDFLKQPAVES